MRTRAYAHAERTTLAMQSREEAPEPAAVSDVAAAEASREVAAAEDGGKSPTSSSMDKERQILVDLVSRCHLGMVANEDVPLSTPFVFTELMVQSPLLLPLRRPMFVGTSSCAPPPPPPSMVKREEPVTPIRPSPPRSLARQHSVALAHYVAAPGPAPALKWSASRAEERSMAPHDEPVDMDPLAAEDGFTCGAMCML